MYGQLTRVFKDRETREFSSFGVSEKEKIIGTGGNFPRVCRIPSRESIVSPIGANVSRFQRTGRMCPNGTSARLLSRGISKIVLLTAVFTVFSRGTARKLGLLSFAFAVLPPSLDFSNTTDIPFDEHRQATKRSLFTSCFQRGKFRRKENRRANGFPRRITGNL